MNLEVFIQVQLYVYHVVYHVGEAISDATLCNGTCSCYVVYLKSIKLEISSIFTQIYLQDKDSHKY